MINGWLPCLCDKDNFIPVTYTTSACMLAWTWAPLKVRCYYSAHFVTTIKAARSSSSSSSSSNSSSREVQMYLTTVSRSWYVTDAQKASSNVVILTQMVPIQTYRRTLSKYTWFNSGINVCTKSKWQIYFCIILKAKQILNNIPVHDLKANPLAHWWKLQTNNPQQ